MKRIFLIGIALFGALSLSFAQLTFRISSVPNNTPANATIYAAGNFNGWDPGDSGYAFTKNTDGTYELTFSPSPGNLSFKFTRGSWETVEGNQSGGYLPNRELAYDGSPTEVSLQILSWEGSGSNSTATYNVSLLSESFYMPQLNRDRRIWVYLPPGYEDSGRTYPVLYMQDGQNVFDAATSAFGEWEVDESLNALFDEGDDGAIVIAIANGGSARLDEYSPWVNNTYGGGEGDAYVDFIVETLKPYVDANYRTKPERESTGIMGSSMGGLISLYAAIEHQSVFGKAGVFSASFWFAPQCYAHVSNTGKEADMRIYLIAGQQEGSSGQQVVDMQAMRSTLLAAGFGEDEVLAVPHGDGTHSEWYWRREFPAAYEWLYADAGPSTAAEQAFLQQVELFPNPAYGALSLRLPPGSKGMEIRLYDAQGRQLWSRPVTTEDAQQIDRSGFLPGVYFLGFFRDGNRLGAKRIVWQ